MSCHNTAERVSGNIFIRPNLLAKAGDVTHGHRHNFDHTTIVFTGAVHVKATLPDGTLLERDFVAPDSFLVKADVEHEITAIADNTIYWCVYAHRTSQGEVSVEHTGWEIAYQ